MAASPDTPAVAKRILLVEDMPMVALLESRQLELLGYEVAKASSGAEALALLGKEAEPFDLVLMDVDLAGEVDGVETARRIMTEREAPVVFLSAHVSRAEVERTQRVEAYGYVAKESGIFVLDAAIRTALRFHAIKRGRDGAGRG